MDSKHADTTALYQGYAAGRIGRREFMQRATALGVAGVAVSLLDHLGAAPAEAAAVTNAAVAAGTAVDVAEWSYFWLGVQRARLARGTVVNGEQMYVEYQVPTQLRHPYPIVLVHGGGGQGVDWMGTPDGRPGWFQYLLQEGYAVYVVDRPGHGRSPYHPDLHGGWPPTAAVLENIEGRFTPPQPETLGANAFQRNHNKWVGTGRVGSRDLSDFVASQGGAYVQPLNVGVVPGTASQGAMQGSAVPPPRAPIMAQRAATMSAALPTNQGSLSVQNEATALAHAVWQQRGAELLDRIGPALIMSHSAAGGIGWIMADARPQLVKGVISIEGGGTPFAGANRWGAASIPLNYDPPARTAAELRTIPVAIPSPEEGVAPYWLQADPPRQLPNLRNVPIVLVTADASFASPGNPGLAAYFRQAGVSCEELRLGDSGLKGYGHMMMVERDNRSVLQLILDWIAKAVRTEGVTASAGTRPRKPGGQLQLADHGYFWVGAESRHMPYGTIVSGQMYVQYLLPKVVRHPYPIVLVHGGTGQMLHYMGPGDGTAGWAHQYLQAGYKVYLVDRPGHGRSPYHPDALGPSGPLSLYESIVPDFRRTASGPDRRWNGSGEIGDPMLDQFMASQNPTMADAAAQHALWASRGAQLLDRIGPAIIQTHSAGGSFGLLAADQRPDRVKALVIFEGGGVPFSPQTPWGMTAAPLAYEPPAQSPSELVTREVPAVQGVAAHRLQEGTPRRLRNLTKIPTLYFTAPASGRSGGPAVVAYLKQAGVPAEHLNLADAGLRGNGHFAMLENNAPEVCAVVQRWIEGKVSG